MRMCPGGGEGRDTSPAASNNRRAWKREMPVHLGSTELDALAADMNGRGYAVLRGAVPDGFIARSAQFVRDELRRRDGQYFCCFGAEPVAGSPLEELGRSAGFLAVLAGLYERGTGRPAPDGRHDMLQVLRVLAGDTGLRHSNRFHYDAYVVTVLLPILIPDGGDDERGDLVLYPNLRPLRSSTLVNLAEKALLQNPAAARLLAEPALQRRLGARVLRMQPGNAYFFWGYRSLHANRPCPPDVVRSTALFHFADPHARSPLIRFIERRHRRAGPAADEPLPN